MFKKSMSNFFDFKESFAVLEKKITEISVENYIAVPFSFRWFLVLLSYVYGQTASLRLWLYRKNIITAKKAPCFVISIGNIVAGGSGKTPMAIYMAEMLKENGFHPVVLSRGYGGSFEKKNEAVVAGDGNNLCCGPDEVGDEPFMMAARASFPVVVGKDRFKGALKAVKLLDKSQDSASVGKAGYVRVLDDGFQHIRLKRDLDILLMDCSRPLGNGRLLPAGRLRERPVGVKRADLIVFTRCSDVHCSDAHCSDDAVRSTQIIGGAGRKISAELENSEEKKNFMTFHRPSLHLFIEGKNKVSGNKDSGKKDNGNKNSGKKDIGKSASPLPNNNIPVFRTLEALSTRKAMLFSGIADNRSFRTTVEDSGIYVQEHLEFNDHHMYKSGDIFQIIESYNACGANLLVTTEKDHARLNRQKEWPMDLAVISIEISFINSQEKEAFDALVISRIKSQ